MSTNDLRVENSQAAIESVVTRQRGFFATGVTIDVEFRLTALRRLEAYLVAHEDQIAAAIKSDLGKSPFESYMAELGMVLAELRYQMKHLRRWARARLRTPDLANFPSINFTVAEPYGVTLVMSPWNYPLLLTLDPLISAVAAGNTCVVKPSAYSPATSRLVADLVPEVFEPGHVDVVLGGRQENAALLEQRFDFIFFTGSPAVGHLVMEKASRYLTPVCLELGGKSPCVVAADADLPLTAVRLAFGKWLNVGQTCIAPDYVLVEESVADQLVELLRLAARDMYGEDAFANPDYGRLVNQRHFDRVCGLIQPEKLVFGGRTKSETLQIDPTVMRCTGDEPVMQEEIFGPVLPVISYKTLEEAEAFIKGREKPLALYLFTENRAVQDRFVHHVPFGGGCINDTIVHIASSHMPFGGVGNSGMGNYHGKWGFDTFSHTKSVLKKYPLDLTMRYQPYDDTKAKLVRTFLR